MTTVTPDCLLSIQVFASLDRSSRSEVASLCKLRVYQKSHVVISHLDESTEVFFVKTGQARAIVYTERGREISYQDLFPGDMFGELSAIDTLPRSTHVVALRDTRVLSMSGREFEHILKSYPEVAQATLRKVVAMVRYLSNRVYEFAALDVSSRIRSELVRLASVHSDHSEQAVIPNLPKHQELANRLATHREAVSRELSVLENQGLIKRIGHSAIIPDTRRLFTRDDLSKTSPTHPLNTQSKRRCDATIPAYAIQAQNR